MPRALFRAAAVLFAFFIAAVVWMADSGIPVSRCVDWLPLGDKVGHFGLLGGLSFLGSLAVRRPVWPGRIGIPWIAPAILVAITVEEASQLGHPNRTFDPGDLAANGLGVAAGMLLALACLRRCRPSSGQA